MRDTMAKKKSAKSSKPTATPTSVPAKVMSPRSKEARTAITQMNPELRQVYDKFTVKVSTLNKNEILTRYELGKSIAAVVTDTRKYGENAAKLLSSALSMSESLLYNFRNLYAQWKDNFEDLKALTDMKSASGVPLSYSHMVVINTLSTATERDSMAKRCLRECLSVEDLKAVVQEKYGTRSNNKGNISPRNPGAGVAVMTKALDKVAEGHKKIQSSIFDRIANKPADFANNPTLEKLQELKAQLSLSKFMLSEDESRLEEIMGTLQELIDGGDAETTEDAEIAEAVGMPAKKSKLVASSEDEDEDDEDDVEEDVEDAEDDEDGTDIEDDEDDEDDDSDDEGDDDEDFEDDDEEDEDEDAEASLETEEEPAEVPKAKAGASSGRSEAKAPARGAQPAANASANLSALERIRQMQQQRAASAKAGSSKPQIGLASV